MVVIGWLSSMVTDYHSSPVIHQQPIPNRNDRNGQKIKTHPKSATRFGLVELYVALTFRLEMMSPSVGKPEIQETIGKRFVALMNLSD